ncbi:MAG: hypothetical protein KIT22_07060 [Verrucomicrobiae bacterium]|nr:hypothetical protein [Verrucomicrobiae bacterium]
MEKLTGMRPAEVIAEGALTGTGIAEQHGVTTAAGRFGGGNIPRLVILVLVLILGTRVQCRIDGLERQLAAEFRIGDVRVNASEWQSVPLTLDSLEIGPKGDDTFRMGSASAAVIPSDVNLNPDGTGIELLRHKKRPE